MSRQTPRKGRNQQQPGGGGGGGGGGGPGHRRQPSQQAAQGQQTQQQIQQQQLEFEANVAMALDDPLLQSIPPAMESVDDLNLRVLQRYEPSISAIEAVAASSVVYALSSETGGWLKAEPQIEGTLFLCQQTPLVVDHYVLPRACVFVLNRKGLGNIVVDLARVSQAEANDGLLSLRLDDETGKGDDDDDDDDDDESGNGSGSSHVLGLWIHGNGAEGSGSGIGGLQFDADTVVQRWRAIRAALERDLGTARLAETAGFLDAAAVVARMGQVARGLNPEGMATSAIGPQPGVKEVVEMVQAQAQAGA